MPDKVKDLMLKDLDTLGKNENDFLFGSAKKEDDHRHFFERNFIKLWGEDIEHFKEVKPNRMHSFRHTTY